MAETIEEHIQKKLFELQDLKHKAFVAKLIPSVDPKTVIGVKTPKMRMLAKEILKMSNYTEFLKILPHKYYEENNIHAFLLERLKDYNLVIELLDKFLPYVDNWSTCDIMRPKIFKKHLPELLKKIKIWLSCSKTYTIRFAIGMLMSFYLDEHFKPEYLDLVANVKSDEYYVNMMAAWYFATALAKQYDCALPYIQNYRLKIWTHNKAIQKAIESYRITPQQKAYLKTLKIKKGSNASK